MTQFLRRLWHLLHQRRARVDLDEELAFHLEMKRRALEAQGAKPGDATRAARRALGNAALAHDQVRDVWVPFPLQGIALELRIAWRILARTPVVSAMAVLSLALGIGANTAIFSIVDSLLLRTLPVASPARLVLVTDGSPTHVRAWSYAIWSEIQRRPALFERSAAWSFTPLNLGSGGEAQRVEGMWVSGSFLDTMGVPARLGRTLSPADDQRGGGADGPVAVISDSFWQRQFGGTPDVLGQSLRVDDVPLTIVGVTPAGFNGPEVGRRFDVMVPLADEPLLRRGDSFLDDSGITFLTIIARLAPGQSLESATAGFRRVQPEIRAATVGDLGRFGSRSAIDRYLKAPFALAPGAIGYSGASDLRTTYERPLTILMVVVALLLLIACVNVANLLVAQAASRRSELSLCLALGASRWRLVRLLGTESALLYGTGAALGLALATAVGQMLVQQISTPANAVFLDLSLDGRVFAFAVAVTMATTLVFGTAPAFRASRVAPIEALKQQGRTGPGAALGALAGWPMVGQVALSLLLVVAAGLFVRTFASLANRPLGFEPARVLLVDVDAARTTNDASKRLRLYERARDAVRALPDAAEAALSLRTPVGRGQFTPDVAIAGVADTRGPVWANLISPRWFDTFGTPVVAGRDLVESDRSGTPRVAVVNEAFARRFFAGGSPIGHTMTLYPHTPRALGPITIVGVAGDAVYGSLRSPAPPTSYLPLAQFDYLADLGIRSITLSVRSKTDAPIRLTARVTTAIGTVDPRLTLAFRPLVDQIGASLAQERLIALLSGLFGVLALVLAGLGLYGVTAYAVAARRTEIGIRLALGAPVARILRLVLSRIALVVGAGVLLGVAASLWASTFVRTLMYGLAPRDPPTLVGAVVVLVGVAFLAAWLPARRAARLDPMSVVRSN
jgi:putative ABC transport system permease protein